jgi:hypothetical protein
VVVCTLLYYVAAAQIVLLHVQPAPCMYLQSFLSSSPRFYSPCLHVQLTYKSYKMYSLVLSDTSALGEMIGIMPMCFQISHHGPPEAKGFGIPTPIYCANNGHSFL